MQANELSGVVFRFGRFRLHGYRRKLMHDELPVRLGDRAFDILLALVEARGDLVTKEELIARAWPGLVVGDINLSVQISAVRKVLDADRDWVKTISGRGFRFVADVVAEADAAANAAGEGDAGSRSRERPTNLPEPTSDLIGRETALQEVLALAAHRRLVTLTGAGGIGKTRLGIEVARQMLPRHPDGVWLAELAPLSDPAMVSAAVGAALGLMPTSGSLSVDRVATALGSRRVLLVLDNCEHVIDAAAAMAEALVKLSPTASVLATSREPLRAEGEAVYHVPPLGVPADDLEADEEVLGHGSVQLFIARARAAESQFPSSRSIAAMATICRHLDGIPLAIELAAARAAALGVEGLAARLNDRFKLLTGGLRTALPRHQTLQATLDWSYDLLPANERVILRRLSVFSGSFTLESAAAVASTVDLPEPDVIDYVGNLVTKSLVAADVGSAVAEYRLLETMRVYAMDKLEQSGEFHQFSARHAHYYRALFERAAAERETRPVAEWLSDYVGHLGNARAALDWAFSEAGDAETGVALTIAVVPLWAHLSHMEECRKRVEQALAQPDTHRGLRRDVQLQAALGAALMYTRGPVPEIASIWLRTLEMADALGDADFHLRALWGLWVDGLTSGNFPGSLEFARKFSARAENQADRAVGDRMAGISLLYLGQPSAAREHIERMLAAYVPPEHGAHVTRFQFDQRVMAHMTLSQIHWLQGHPEQALRTVEANIEYALQAGHALSLCNALGQSACPIALLCGDHAAAGRYLDILLDTMSRHALSNWFGFTQSFRGLLLIRQGEHARGLQILRAALDEYPRMGWALRYTAFSWDGELAQALSGGGDNATAMGIVEEAIARSDRTGERWCIAELLRTRGELLLQRTAGAGARQAEHEFIEALGWARKQGALSWELRSASSLAKLLRSQGRADEARAWLAPVYARFTEGFETDDLVAAKTLIELP